MIPFSQCDLEGIMALWQIGQETFCLSSASLIGTPGSRSDGFSTKALPQMMAGPNIPIGIMPGNLPRSISPLASAMVLPCSPQ
jgi:hypothetical protein